MKKTILRVLRSTSSIIPKKSGMSFALKFRVIADTRGYRGIIDGAVIPPDEMAAITITAEDTDEELEEKRIY